MEHGFHADAWQELLAAITWHDSRSSGSGRELARAVARKIAQLERFPDSAPRHPGMPPRFDVRRMGLTGWPYSMFLATVTRERRVIAFAHDKRRPGYWHDRLR